MKRVNSKINTANHSFKGEYQFDLYILALYFNHDDNKD